LKKHIFIIRIWCENRDLEKGKSMLRGVIQHIPSSKKQVITDFNSIREFIAPFLPEANYGSVSATKKESDQRQQELAEVKQSTPAEV